MSDYQITAGEHGGWKVWSDSDDLAEYYETKEDAQTRVEHLRKHGREEVGEPIFAEAKHLMPKPYLYLAAGLIGFLALASVLITGEILFGVVSLAVLAALSMLFMFEQARRRLHLG